MKRRRPTRRAVRESITYLEAVRDAFPGPRPSLEETIEGSRKSLARNRDTLGLTLRRQDDAAARKDRVWRGLRAGKTAEQIAQEEGVTVRTIERDKDKLRDAGLPTKRLR